MNSVTNSPIRRGASACLDHYIGSFEQGLVARNYKAATIKTYRAVIHRLGKIIEERGIELADLTVERAAELVKGEERNKREPNKCANIVRRFVRHLIDIGVAKEPLLTAKQIARLNLRRDYEEYLRRQMGLSEPTIYDCWRFADRFLDHRFGDEAGDLRHITPADVIAFLQRLTTRKPPFKDKTPPTHLRNFFKYLFKCGLTPTNLALCVPRVTQRYGRRLPRHLAPEQVEALLAAVRDNPKHGRRDYAMLLLTQVRQLEHPAHFF